MHKQNLNSCHQYKGESHMNLQGRNLFIVMSFSSTWAQNFWPRYFPCLWEYEI